MKMCPKCKKVYSNKFNTCNNCKENLIICTKDDLMKTTTVQVIKNQKEVNIPKCPVCQSPNIEKFGTLERAASVTMLGIFSKKINKSFKCKNCGYTF